MINIVYVSKVVSEKQITFNRTRTNVRYQMTKQIDLYRFCTIDLIIFACIKKLLLFDIKLFTSIFGIVIYYSSKHLCFEDLYSSIKTVIIVY